MNARGARVVVTLTLALGLLTRAQGALAEAPSGASSVTRDDTRAGERVARSPRTARGQRGQPPAEARALRELANAERLLAQDRRPAAERAFRRALRLDPGCTPALRGLATALLGELRALARVPDERSLARAVQVLQALDQAPRGVREEQLQLVEALALTAQGDHRAALRVLARAPRVASTELVPALDTLALLAAERRDLDTSEAALRLACELQPGAPRVQRLASVLLARGRAHGAVTVVRAGLAFEPDSIALHLALAEALLAAGDSAGAEGTLARVAGRCPWRCDALLARVALESGDMPLAVRRARALLARPRAEARVVETGATSPEMAAAPEDALAEQASRATAGYVLGLALARQGDVGAARAALESVLRDAPEHRGARQALRALEAPRAP